VTLTDTKRTYLDYFHDQIPPHVDDISKSGETHQNKAKLVNKVISDYRDFLVSQIDENASLEERQERLIVLQYTVSVVSLEYRHAVWPYEYMAFSRRVGELWERFCTAAWDIPSRPEVERTSAPKFNHVLLKIETSLLDHAQEERKAETTNILENLRDLIGEINMVEDEVFSVEGNPHVIDFKSGFGSNEKGNMLRLRTVGKAYKLWNPATELLFLVRQEQNNNYLNVIKKEGLWSVHCGRSAYDKIEELTGAKMNKIREQVICFEDDLSDGFWNDLNEHLSDLSSYLKW
jgi:hypothetical protein